MLTILVSTLVALAAAAAVLVVASVAGGRPTGGAAGTGTLRADVRAGLRTWRAGRRGDPDAGPDPVDTSMDEFLSATAVQDPAYLGVEDLTETLARARQRAARGVTGRNRR